MNADKINKLLTQSNENINSTVKYISAIQNKEIIPISSGIDHLDKILLGGLFPDMIISIVARAAQGKSHTINQLRTQLLSGNEDIGVLLWNLEMPFFTLILVELKKALKKSLKSILGNPMTEEEKPMYKKVADGFRDSRLTKIDETVTPEEWYLTTKEYIERNKHKRQLFILLDHIGIIKGKSKTESIAETIEYANMLKLEYKGLLTFIILGQMNREIENTWRNWKEVNPLLLRPLSNSIFSSDSLMFFSDVIVAQVIPQVVGMEKYATVNAERYPHLKPHFIEEDKDKEYARLKGLNRIYYDYLKVRLPDGEPTLYCSLLDPEAEEVIMAHAHYEKNYTNKDEEVVF